MMTNSRQARTTRISRLGTRAEGEKRATEQTGKPLARRRAQHEGFMARNTVRMLMPVASTGFPVITDAGSTGRTSRVLRISSRRADEDDDPGPAVDGNIRQEPGCDRITPNTFMAPCSTPGVGTVGAAVAAPDDRRVISLRTKAATQW